jgi:hypothetical protein
MTSAAAGSSIRLRFGGNGHSRGAPMGDAGTVTVYWKGAPELEITDISEFTPQNTLQTAGFAADSFSYPADPKVITPVQGLVDKGNWLLLNLPADMAPGRHMMVWTWSYSGAVQWSTCFDVNVTGGSGSPASSSTAAPADTKPVTAVSVVPVIPMPVANAQTPETYGDTPAAPAASAAASAVAQSPTDSYGSYDEKPSAPSVAAAAPSVAAPSVVAAPSTPSMAPAAPAAPLASPAGQVQSPTSGDAPKKHCKAKYDKRSHPRAF